MFRGLLNYLHPQRSTIFFTGGVSGVQNFKYVYSVFCVVSVVWSVRFPGFVMFFNLWICTGFIFEPCSLF